MNVTLKRMTLKEASSKGYFEVVTAQREQRKYNRLHLVIGRLDNFPQELQTPPGIVPCFVKEKIPISKEDTDIDRIHRKTLGKTFNQRDMLFLSDDTPVYPHVSTFTHTFSKHHVMGIAEGKKVYFIDTVYDWENPNAVRIVADVTGTGITESSNDLYFAYLDGKKFEVEESEDAEFYVVEPEHYKLFETSL